MTTYQDLIAQKEALLRQQAELERQIAEQLKGQRAEAIAQIKAQMAEHGLTVADLADAPKRGRKPRETTADAPRKVAAKYRDPATGATWSGRGLKPKWLAAALSEGRTLDDFAL